MTQKICFIRSTQNHQSIIHLDGDIQCVKMQSDAKLYGFMKYTCSSSYTSDSVIVQHLRVHHTQVFWHHWACFSLPSCNQWLEPEVDWDFRVLSSTRTRMDNQTPKLFLTKSPGFWYRKWQPLKLLYLEDINVDYNSSSKSHKYWLELLKMFFLYQDSGNRPNGNHIFHHR